MHLTLIRPPKLMIRGTATMKPAAPLGLAYIAGATEAAGHKVTLIDDIANHLYFLKKLSNRITVVMIHFFEFC